MVIFLSGMHNYSSCKIILKLNFWCSQKLKAIGDKMAGVSDLPHTDREVDDVEDSLPDRVVTPEGYRQK